ncbi:MAG: TSUP family transporter [Desulfomonile tiedjei]|nr:TSUP family transporter [Desulfomonile tiedjei]
MEWLYLYMPMAQIHVLWPVLLLIGFSVGVVGGFFGMGGAWMVTPALNILGFPMAMAIGTDIAHTAGKSIISTHRHSQFGNVDYKLGAIMILGTVIGIECGAQLVIWLDRIGHVEPVVRWCYVALLLTLAFVVFADHRKAMQNLAEGIPEGEPVEGFTWYKSLHDIKIRPMMHFPVSGVYCSLWLPVVVTFLSGIMAGFLGIGGGLVRMPALVHLVGLPTHVAVGTDLFEVMISGLYGTFTYGVKGRIEVLAVMVMLTGAAVGAQIGTVATKYVKGYGIRLVFGMTAAACAISVMLKEFGYSLPATVVILGSVAILCVYICTVMFRGAAQELREKASAEAESEEAAGENVEGKHPVGNLQDRAVAEDSATANVLESVRGDVARMEADAVVSPATGCDPFGVEEVDHPVHRAAGPALSAECCPPGHCEPGDMRICEDRC